MSGEVVEVNEELLDSPELINQDAFAAWLIKVSDPEVMEDLLSYEDYIKTIKE